MTAPDHALRAECFVPGNHLMAGLLGTRDEHLRQIEAAFPDEQIVVQGNRISRRGPRRRSGGAPLRRAHPLVQAGQDMDSSTLARTIDMVREDIRPSEVLRSEVVRAAGGKTVRPNTAGQKRYVDAISQNVITFGIGPAGTGKSLSRRGPGRARAAVAARCRASSSPARPSRRGSGSASCPAT